MGNIENEIYTCRAVRTPSKMKRKYWAIMRHKSRVKKQERE